MVAYYDTQFRFDVPDRQIFQVLDFIAFLQKQVLLSLNYPSRLAEESILPPPR